MGQKTTELKKELEYNVPEWCKLSKLIYAPWNYKIDDDNKQLRFEESVRRNGMAYPLIIAQREEEPESEQWEVVDGNHRLQAFKETFKPHKVMVHKMGRMSRAERMLLGVGVNEWAFDKDPYKFAQCFKDLLVEYTMDDLMDTMPFEEEELERTLELIDFDYSEYTKGTEEITPKGGTDKIDMKGAQPRLRIIFAKDAHYLEAQKIYREATGKELPELPNTGVPIAYKEFAKAIHDFFDARGGFDINKMEEKPNA